MSDQSEEHSLESVDDKEREDEGKLWHKRPNTRKRK